MNIVLGIIRGREFPIPQRAKCGPRAPSWTAPTPCLHISKSGSSTTYGNLKSHDVVVQLQDLALHQLALVSRWSGRTRGSAHDDVRGRRSRDATKRLLGSACSAKKSSSDERKTRAKEARFTLYETLRTYTKSANEQQVIQFGWLSSQMQGQSTKAINENQTRYFLKNWLVSNDKMKPNCQIHPAKTASKVSFISILKMQLCDTWQHSYLFNQSWTWIMIDHIISKCFQLMFNNIDNP